MDPKRTRDNRATLSLVPRSPTDPPPKVVSIDHKLPARSRCLTDRGRVIAWTCRLRAASERLNDIERQSLVRSLRDLVRTYGREPLKGA